MQVSVEALKGLEHKITVVVPNKKVEEEVNLRLRNLARKVRIDGFRPGKAPLAVVKKRFLDSIHEEVAKEMVQSTFYEALQESKLTPAGSPLVEPQQVETGKDFIYSAIIETFPEIVVKEFDQDEIEIVAASVETSDVNAMLEKLREQNKLWEVASRPLAMGDKALIDFKGFVDDKPFEGGKADHYEIILGSGTMIPGFEEGLVNGEKDKPFDIEVSFPNDYGHQALAGKKARFEILIHEIYEGILPPLDDNFAEKFNIKDGGMDALSKDIKENMVRELERRIKSLNREAIFNKLLTLNSFEVPKTLVDKEIENLKHEMYHRVFGHEHSDNEKIPDFPRMLFEEQAKRRVQLGLLFSEYVKKHELKADSARVDAMIEKLASAYEDPEELRHWYKSNKEHLAEIEALVMEEVVAEKMSENAKLLEITKRYDEVMNPPKTKVSEDKGE